MKRTLLLLPVFFIAISSFAQAGIDDVISAMKSGNASGVTKYFDSYVDITMPDKSSNYSKSQGELIIKDFFTNSGVKNFDVKHKGNNDNGDYCIGTLQTKNGSYRTTVYMRLKGNKQVIQDIRIQQL
ncbi:MAG TPA: DUF4783 domain-containing protein [Chitinophagaceae bacterium]|jgi:hypothetical protein|nr:DUF4783 domain-containing protein [Chitinophagaceae bacterium]